VAVRTASVDAATGLVREEKTLSALFQIVSVRPFKIGALGPGLVGLMGNLGLGLRRTRTSYLAIGMY